MSFHIIDQEMRAVLSANATVDTFQWHLLEKLHERPVVDMGDLKRPTWCWRGPAADGRATSANYVGEQCHLAAAHNVRPEEPPDEGCQSRERRFGYHDKFVAELTCIDN